MGYAATVTADAMGLPDPTLMTLLEEALTVVPASAISLRAQLLARLALGLSLDVSASDRRLRLSEESLQLARASGDARALAPALVARYFALLGPDHIEEPLALAGELVRIGETIGSPTTALDGRLLRIPLLVMRGDIAAVDREIAVVVPRAEAMRLPHWRWLTCSVRTLRALLGGRFDDAERLADEALSLAPALESLAAPQFYTVQQFNIRREQDRVAELAPQLAAVAEVSTYLLAWRAGLALLRFVVGERDAAAADLVALGTQRFADFPRDGTWLTALVNLAEIAHGVDDRANAQPLYDLLRPHASSAVVVGAAVCLGSVEHYLALLASTLGRLDDAAAHFEAALAAHARLDAPALRARTAYEYARLLGRRGQQRDAERAAALLAQAHALAEALGMAALLRQMREGPAPGARAEPVRTMAAELRRDSYGWALAFDGAAARLPDSRGMHYLARLLAVPGVHQAATELAGVPPGQDAGEWLDPKARAALHERATELRAEIDDAEQAHDLGRIERARTELEALTEEVARSRGLAGRSRRLGSVAERARVNVTRRIAAALKKIAPVHPVAAHYLETTIRTGTSCVFIPDPRFPVSWTVEPGG